MTTDGDMPAVYKSTHPAWNDENLREVARQIRTPLLFAHVRASSGTPIQRSNCHPFRHGRWLWMHNGSLAQFPKVKRDLQVAVDPSLYRRIEGESIWIFRYSSEKSTSSSSLFYSNDVAEVRALYPELDTLDRLGPQSRFIVSEPLRDLPGAWTDVPEGSWAVIRHGEQEIQPFEPVVPA